MVYCYECGEQVAENDTFCPYCGITLSPSVAPADDEEVSSEVIPEQPKPLTDAEFLDAPTQKPAPIAAQKADFANDVTAESFDLSVESLPAPPSSIQSPPPEVSPRFGQPDNYPINPAPPAFETVQPVEETVPPEVVAEKANDIEISFKEAEQGEQKPVEEINLTPVFVESEGGNIPKAAVGKNLHRWRISQRKSRKFPRSKRRKSQSLIVSMSTLSMRNRKPITTKI